ncbi:MAG: nucleotide exchange factor GrpE [Clostridia bacterium]|nr:nucleotide exchange factor GrpE [Clostridia bacterium]
MAEEKLNEQPAEELADAKTQPEEAEKEPAEQKQEPVYEPMTLTAEEVKALREKLDKLQEDRDDAVRQAQRLQAEFENYRKRNAQIAADSRDDGVRETVKALLPVADNFERALENAPEDAFAEGIRNISKQFETALRKCGAEEIEAEGEFDPKLHDAVMKDSVEGVPSGHITAVLQKGWRVKGKIVRYSMVKVNE